MYSNDQTFISSESSQLFNVTCKQDFTHVDVEHEVTEVTVQIDEIQNAFDGAYLVNMDITDPYSGTSLTGAALNDPVKLVVSLAPVFRNDFNIQIDSCFINSTAIYSAELGSLTPYFNNFVEESEDVFASIFYLFRPPTNTLTSRLNFNCVITTCLGECPGVGGERKKRSVNISHEIVDNSSEWIINPRFWLFHPFHQSLVGKKTLINDQ